VFVTFSSFLVFVTIHKMISWINTHNFQSFFAESF
jgi:hypothetical protein